VTASQSITLAWPPRELSPNYRSNWSKRARFTKAYRTACAEAAWLTGVRPIAGHDLKEIVFHPPTKARHDRDNLIARFKAGQDGLADALGVNDAEFNPQYRIGTVVKGGAVVAIVEDNPG